MLLMYFTVDFKNKYPRSTFWRYTIPAQFMMAAIIVLTLLPAVWTYRKNAWMTR